MMPVVETLGGEPQQTQQPLTQPPLQQHTWLFFDDSFKGPLKPGSGYSVWNAADDKDGGEGVPSFGSESVDEASSEEEGCDLLKLLSSNEFERVKPHLGQTKRDIFYDIFNVDILEALGTELEPHMRPIHAPSRDRRMRIATANQKAMESMMMTEEFRREECCTEARPIKRTRLETDPHQQFPSILIPSTFHHGYNPSTTIVSTPSIIRVTHTCNSITCMQSILNTLIRWVFKTCIPPINPNIRSPTCPKSLCRE
ncbi:hypothetical protein BC829DRAFT_71699 [Chytridium lagenaria]|nr:hypothetical protein BC829DRAFT_71699 [Chytridium lagenaria]